MALNKLFKYVVIIVVSLLMLAVLGELILVAMVNPNDYKPLIKKQFVAATGRKLSFGKLSWELVPYLGLKAENVSVSNPPKFNHGRKFVKIKSMDISLDLWALVNKSIEIKKLYIRGADLYLISAGKDNNWTFNVNNGAGKHQNTKNANTISVLLNSIQLKHINIHYHNLATHTTKVVRDLSILAKDGFDSGLDVNSNTGDYTVHNLKFDLGDAAHGTLNLHTNLKKKEYVGSITGKISSLGELFTQLGIPSHKSLKNDDLQPINLSSDLLVGKHVVSLPNISIDSGDDSITGHILAKMNDMVEVHDSFSSDEFDLANVIDFNGLHLILNKLNISGHWNWQEGEFKQLSGTQNVTVKNVSLQGFSVAHMISNLNNITDVIHFDKHHIEHLDVLQLHQVDATYKNLKDQVSDLQSPHSKNLRTTTNLGSFSMQIEGQSGELSTSQFDLTGPYLIANGTGMINVPHDWVKYTVIIRLLNHKDNIIRHLVFPYDIDGSLTRPYMGVDDGSIRKQIAKYYARKLARSAGKTGKDVIHDTGKVIKKSTGVAKKIKRLF